MSGTDSHTANELNLGEFTFYKDERGALCCRRHGLEWRDFLGDHAITALFDYAQRSETRRTESAPSATVPPGWKLVCEKCGANQGEACGWPAKCEASAVTEIGAPVVKDADGG